MKRFTAITLAALMVLAVFASVIPATAVTVDKVEIRGPVLTGLTNDPANASTNTITTSNFAGFYYDFKKDLGTEVMTVKLDSATSRTVAAANLTYTTTIMDVNYTSSNLENLAPVDFQMIGYLAEKYVPISTDKSDKLSKLLVDDKDTHTIRTGQAYELGEGYAVTAQQVDVEGKKVWLELTKNGEYVADKIIEIGTLADQVWAYEQDIAGEKDVVTVKIFVEQVFQGQVDSLAVIKGIWQISDSVMEVTTDDKIGKLEVTTVGGTTITMKNENSFTMSQNSIIDLTSDLKFNVADSSTIRFYLMKEYTTPGTYEVRGTAMTIDASMSPANVSTWTADSFAGFFYDLKNDKQYETMVLNAGNNTVPPSNSQNRSIAAAALVYTATIKDVNYTSSNLENLAPVDFQKIGYLAAEYVPISTDKSDKLSKLLVDDKDTHTIRTGQAYELGEGYAVTAQQVDVEGKKVWLELTKNGEYVADKIIEIGILADQVWAYEQDIAGEKDVVTVKIFVEQVFQGQVDSLAVIKGIWQISDSVLEVTTDDKIGKLEVTDVGSTTIVMKNENSFTLTQNSDIEIASGIQFKVADDSTLTRIYPFIEYTITGEVVEEAPVDEVPVEEVPVEEVPVDEVPVEEVPVEEVPVEVPVEEAPVEEAPVEEPEEEPGFEAIFAIAGLLAVAFLVRRNK